MAKEQRINRPCGVVVSLGAIGREQWLAYRRTGIGGSDAATVVGLNPYSSLSALYADKKGLMPEREDNERMRLGRDLEQYVADRFCERTGKRVRRPGYMYRSHLWPCMIADVDREVVEENAGLECKTMGRRPEGLEDGQVPPRFYVQCMHYMAVRGYEKMYLAILVYGDGLYDFEIARDEEQIRALAKAETAFWQGSVLASEPPDPDGTAASAEAVKAMFPEAEAGKEIVLAAEQDLRVIDVLTEQIKDFQQQLDAAKQRIQQEMGDADRAVCQGWRIDWPTVSRTTVDTKKLKSEFPSVYAQVAKTASSRRFTIRKEQ